MDRSDLASYVERVDASARTRIEAAPLHPDQLRLLIAAACGSDASANPLRHPLAPMYMLLRAFGGQPDEAAVRVGTALLLVQRCMCLVDDLEDDELPPELAAGGTIIAVNAGLALYLFAVDELRAAERLLGIASDEASPWSSLRSHALRLCRAQHLDIAGRDRARTPAEAMALATEKSAFSCMLVEIAAICARRRERKTLDMCRRIGDGIAGIHQTIDDVSDLFAGAPSADLRTGTCTAPLAFLLEAMSSDERERWLARPREQAGEQQQVLTRTLYERGAMQRVAEELDELRSRVLAELDAAEPVAAYAALFVAWLDDLLAIVYRPMLAPPALDILSVDAGTIDAGDLPVYERLRAARGRTVARLAGGSR